MPEFGSMPVHAGFVVDKDTGTGFSEYFIMPTSVSLHRRSMFIHSSVTDGADINIKQREVTYCDWEQRHELLVITLLNCH
jgi:hypothetical protein